MVNDLFEMCFELEDIEEAFDSGYKNVYDITVEGDHTFVLGNGIVSHNSAFGGLSPVLGRKDCGYFTLRGKPLNAYSATQSKFTSNKELSDLYMVLKNEEYDYIVFASDQDLDGFHIRGLLIGFFERYFPDLKGKIGMLQTPVITVKKSNKLVSWNYSLSDEVKLAPGDVSKYMKGLGSWKESDLKHIVQTDGLDSMIEIIDFDNDEIINDWLSDSTADKRKEYIINNSFDIALI